MATREEIRIFNLADRLGSDYDFRLAELPMFDPATGLYHLTFKRGSEIRRVPLFVDELLQSANSGALSAEIKRKIEAELED